MKSLILSILLASSTALAALTDVDRAEFAAKSILKDSGFETGKAAWVASGGTFSIVTSGTNLLEGKSSATWDSSAAAQTLTSTAVAIPKGLYAQNGEAICYIQTPSGTATHLLEVYDGTNVLGSITVTSSTTPSKAAVNFPFPLSGNIQLRLKSVNANEPLIAIDGCYLGKSSVFNNMISSQWISAGTMTIGGSTTAPVKGTTSTDSIKWRRDGSDLVALYQYHQTAVGSATAGSGDYIFTLPAGLVADTSIVPATAGLIGNVVGGALQTSKIGTGHVTNGSSRGVAIPFLISSTQFAVGLSNTFSLYQAFGSAYFELNGTATVGFSFEIRVPIQGWGPSGAIAADQTDYGWTAYTPTVSNFGTVSSTDCYHSRVATDLLVRCKFVTSTGGAASEARVSFPTGLTSSASISTLEHAGNLLMNTTSVGVLAALVEPSVTYFTFSRDSATSNLNKVNGNTLAAGGFTYSMEARVPIAGWIANQRAPTLVGSVTSNSNGAEKIERLLQSTACTSTPCTPNQQSGSWVGSTYVRSSTGQYVMTVSGWSAQPSCTCSYGENSTSGLCSVEVTSSTSIKVRIQDAAFAQADKPYSLICMGPR